MLSKAPGVVRASPDVQIGTVRRSMERRPIRSGDRPRLHGHAGRVTPDGTATLVRGLQFDTVPHAAFRDILDASTERRLHSYRATLPSSMPMMAMMQDGPQSGVVASLIAPNLIFEELEIEEPDRPFQRPPLVPAPLP